MHAFRKNMHFPLHKLHIYIFEMNAQMQVFICICAFLSASEENSSSECTKIKKKNCQSSD